MTKKAVDKNYNVFPMGPEPIYRYDEDVDSAYVANVEMRYRFPVDGNYTTLCSLIEKQFVWE